MQFQAKDYYIAGVERIKQAEIIYHNGQSFALAMYCGGLAVECLLRAFRWKEDQSFEGRHNLDELLKASRLLRIDEDYLRSKDLSEESILKNGKRLRTAMNDIIILWNNSHRFTSEAKLKEFLNKIGRLKGGKGDPLKKNAWDLIEAAGIIFERGIVLWTSKTR